MIEEVEKREWWEQFTAELGNGLAPFPEKDSALHRKIEECVAHLADWEKVARRLDGDDAWVRVGDKKILQAIDAEAAVTDAALVAAVHPDRPTGDDFEEWKRWAWKALTKAITEAERKVVAREALVTSYNPRGDDSDFHEVGRRDDAPFRLWEFAPYGPRVTPPRVGEKPPLAYDPLRAEGGKEADEEVAKVLSVDDQSYLRLVYERDYSSLDAYIATYPNLVSRSGSLIVAEWTRARLRHQRGKAEEHHRELLVRLRRWNDPDWTGDDGLSGSPPCIQEPNTGPEKRSRKNFARAYGECVDQGSRYHQGRLKEKKDASKRIREQTRRRKLKEAKLAAAQSAAPRTADAPLCG
ncbi:hypothetical protein [Limnoglobus roseus]|uniref:Uncharacterized protein n=1 Tax=Limnoglobus roseus TaxID=2598579 RepID=A0A5C1A7S1_9BACT|nr:hypothetical protein [Limnoglobus roseus]QEL14277.1 hypothetical protein PX52LOC_01148 [Limnoglobus roseus]